MTKYDNTFVEKLNHRVEPQRYTEVHGEVFKNKTSVLLRKTNP